jgi:hypothetical protein
LTEFGIFADTSSQNQIKQVPSGKRNLPHSITTQSH